MQILVNENNIDIKLDKERNLEELLVRLQDEVRQKDASKLVVTIKVNGEEILSSQEDMALIDISHINKLEVTTDDISKTAVNALTEIKRQLPDLSDAMVSISCLFQEGNREEALETFSKVCSEWRKIIQFFDSLAVVFMIDYSQLKVDDKSFDTINEELLNLLTDTRTAIANDDMVMLSDLIEYELAPKISEETIAVDNMIEFLKNSTK
ncbi:hypothetical protein J7L67_09930 [bacterium]|nr:hypothetical protein [bacterium]